MDVLMAYKMASRLETFLKVRTDDSLRSIIIYERDDYEIEFIRSDVAAQYSEDEIEEAIDESRFESLTGPNYTDIFSDDHGELLCLSTCYEHVIELNFVLSDGVGAAIAIDAEAMDEAKGLVADARDIVIDSRPDIEA